MCTVGRLVPHKQVEHAIEACLRLRAELLDVHLTVAGSGWWEDELAAYAHEHGAEEWVTFAGHVSEERRSEIYASVLGDGAAVTEGRLGAGHRGGGDLRDARRSPTGPPAAPGSRSRRDGPGCWPTTSTSSWPGCAAC